MVIKGYQNQGSNGNISFQCHYGREIVIGTTGVENRRSIPVAITNKARTASKLSRDDMRKDGNDMVGFFRDDMCHKGPGPS
jgi:hypothetical protein